MQNIRTEVETESPRTVREILTRVAGAAAALAGLGLVIDTTIDATSVIFDPTPAAAEQVVDVAGDHSMLPGVLTILGGSAVSLTGAYFAFRDQK